MNQVLSQNEVDALLAAVSQGEMEGGSEVSSGDDRVVVVYDLTSQDRVIRGRLPQLDVIYEKFMRTFRVSLSSALRKVTSLNHASTDFLKFGEFVNTLPIPTCVSVIKLGDLRGSALLVIDSKLAYSLVDSFLGGDERPYKVEGKDFTPIEVSIIKKVVDLAIQDLEQAWDSIYPIKCTFLRTEVNPQFVGIVPPSDVVIASTFDVELENTHGSIILVIPYSTIEPIKQKLSTGFQIESDKRDKKIWSSVIKDQILNTHLNIKVDLGESELSLKEITALKVGDVIPLNQDADGEFDILVEDTKKYQGLYGIHRGSVAVQITKKV